MSDRNEVIGDFRWIRNPEQKGEFLFTFDGKQIFNLFRDYPHKLTKAQKNNSTLQIPTGQIILRTEHNFELTILHKKSKRILAGSGGLRW